MYHSLRTAGACGRLFAASHRGRGNTLCEWGSHAASVCAREALDMLEQVALGGLKVKLGSCLDCGPGYVVAAGKSGKPFNFGSASGLVNELTLELHVHFWASLDQDQQLLQGVSCNMHESGQTFAELSCLHVCTCKADVQSWGWVRADNIALARFSPHRLS